MNPILLADFVQRLGLVDRFQDHFRLEARTMKAAIEQAEPGAEPSDIQGGRGDYRKSSETVDERIDRILELVKNQNAY